MFGLGGFNLQEMMEKLVIFQQHSERLVQAVEGLERDVALIKKALNVTPCSDALAEAMKLPPEKDLEQIK